MESGLHDILNALCGKSFGCVQSHLVLRHRFICAANPYSKPLSSRPTPKEQRDLRRSGEIPRIFSPPCGCREFQPVVSVCALAIARMDSLLLICVSSRPIFPGFLRASAPLSKMQPEATKFCQARKPERRQARHNGSPAPFPRRTTCAEG